MTESTRVPKPLSAIRTREIFLRAGIRMPPISMTSEHSAEMLYSKPSGT
ncbi:hypothetical protein [Nocardia neocaledoniensis]|nr:hypothetical protein [Nocardia neocaledoniensis]